MMRGPEHDVAIIGGGAVGLALAAALTHEGFSAVVVERARARAVDARVSTIVAGACRMLTTIGIWDALADAACPIRRIETYAGARAITPALSFDAADAGDAHAALAHVVENKHLVKALLGALDAAGVVQHTGAQVARLETDTSGTLCYLSDGTEIRARLCVAADGALSTLRAAAGIETFARAYDQNAISARLVHDRPHDNIARQWFLPSGALALLPVKTKMGTHESGLFWMQTPARAKELCEGRRDDFRAALNAVLPERYACVRVVGVPSSFPLGLRVAREVAAPRLVLVGDAAHLIHPLAGQGLNLGFKDVAALCDAVKEARRLGLDIGGVDMCARYAQKRRFDSVVFSFATDALNAAFSGSFNRLAGLALRAGQAVAPARRFFARAGAGVAGDVPRLFK